MRRSPVLIVAALMLLALCGGIGAQTAFAETPSSAGIVKFVKRTEPAFNRFMESPTGEYQSWINQHLWRSEVFTPYFDAKTSWYPHGWVYKDLYAIYTGSAFAKEHEEWILRDAAGNRLYIPWGCSGGTCPQYAGDIASSAYRHAWIAEAKAALAHGYAGLWIDDVNLSFRVSNGNGEQVAPLDPNTGRTMTETAWQEYVATFTEEIRTALPSAEILHNSIWYAGGPERLGNPSVKREISSANYINLERGVNDEGLTGGNGEWSVKALLSFADYVNSSGRGVILDGGSNTPTGREYSLAAYYLISSGNDGLGNGAMTPENWWSAYDANLGEAEGARTEWNGLLRRNFSDGIALLNEPGEPARTVTLPAPMYNTEGKVVSTVTIGAAGGAVLRYVEPPSATKESSPVAVPIIVQLGEHTADGGQVAVLQGQVSAPAAGEVEIQVQRLASKHWVTAAKVRVKKVRTGSFGTRLMHLRHGRYRVRAVFKAAKTRTARSSRVSFAIAAHPARSARRSHEAHAA